MVSVKSVVRVATVSCWLAGLSVAQGSELLQALEELRVARGELRDPLWWKEEAARIDAAHAAAFALRGFEVDGDPDGRFDGLAGQVRAELSAGLDYWALVRREGAGRPGRERMLRLLDVSGRLDSDPWRSRLRSCLSGTGLRADELMDLAGAEELSGQPPASLMALGQALQARGETEVAVEILQKAVQAHPGDLALGVALGVALEQLDPPQTAEAVAAYRKVLALRPDHVQVQHRVAVALQEMGDAEGALAIFSSLIEAEPEVAHWLWHAGWNVSEHGDWARAKTLFRQGIALEPEFERPVLSLGNAYTQEGDHEAAIAHYRAALAINPSFVTAYNNLGIAYLRLGDPGKSWQNYLIALSMAPRYSWSVSGSRSAGRALLDADETIASCRNVAEASPRDEMAQLRLGLALRSLGRSAEAVEFLEAAHRLRVQRAPHLAGLTSGYLEEARSLAAEETRLLDIAEGRLDADSDQEQMQVARLLARRTSFAAAASAFIKVMKRSPGAFTDIEAGHRYQAARAAVMAGTDQRGGQALVEPDAARWREQAMAWLRADLASWASRATQDPTGAEPALELWRIDPALDGVRVEARLAQLPTSEADRWRKLWHDVAEFLERIRS